MCKGLRQVGAGLVGKADEHPKHIGHLVGKVFLAVALFKRLFAIGAGDDSGHFANLFGKQRHIRQFAKIAHAVCPNPLIDLLLRLFDCNVHSCLF